MDKMPGYYAILTPEIRYNKELKAIEKLLYAEITALSNSKGFCFAKNSYFADLYDVDSVTISRYISHLEKLNFIKCDYKKCGNVVKERYIYINTVNNSVNETVNNSVNRTVDQIVKENNTSINNTRINNIKSSELPFPEPEDILDGGSPCQTESSSSTTKVSSDKFKKTDYSECIKIFKDNQESLKARNVSIETTDYPYPVMSRLLKKAFQSYGVEKTKLGIKQSIQNNWLVQSAHYSFTAMLSDTVFSKCISLQNSINSTTRVNHGKSFVNYTDNASNMNQEDF